MLFANFITMDMDHIYPTTHPPRHPNPSLPTFMSSLLFATWVSLEPPVGMVTVVFYSWQYTAAVNSWVMSMLCPKDSTPLQCLTPMLFLPPLSHYSLSLGDGVSVDVLLKAEHSIVAYSSALRPVVYMYTLLEGSLVTCLFSKGTYK